MSPVAPSIAEEIRAVIQRGFERPLPPEDFSDIACRVFAYQYEANLPYREYCVRRRVHPSCVKSYHDIPAVPASAFKEMPLACFPVTDAVNYFRTSGTTEGRHGKHYVREYSLYENSMKKTFSHFVMPDSGKFEMLILSVPPAFEPHSSLIYMFDVVRKTLGDELSAWYMDGNGILFDSVTARLRIIEKEVKPVCLLGTSLAFGYFSLWCENREIEGRASSAILRNGYSGSCQSAEAESITFSISLRRRRRKMPAPLRSVCISGTIVSAENEGDTYSVPGMVFPADGQEANRFGRK